ncbi:glycerol-1-phosphate dehydrogenase, partial [Streptococcus pneumoniae]|nr:glycerol-1-phosphate dehydrogenase [Streptococcus pneumoniae]
MKNNDLKIGSGAIHQISATLSQNNISGKILYCADPVVDDLYGSIVRSQIEEIGRVKEESCNYNT